ncbi:MAG TPA: ArsR family transcriptional regulator [Salinarimonas sp.]|nr:ArsR family transcriptional regulator [Salinarimonas sp.]
MGDIGKFPLHVPPEKALAVLKALSNESRLKMMRLLAKEPLGVTEIARLIGVTQPTATVYIQQLEEAGLISFRFVKTPQGVQKISYTLYDGILIDWLAQDGALMAEEHAIDMPVGHYAMIQCGGRSLMASKARVIASREDVSKFFNPVRMDAELLVLEEGSVRYLFPFNVPQGHTVQSLKLSLEVAAAYPGERRSSMLLLHVNGREIGPISLDNAGAPMQRAGSMPDWLPQDLAEAGRLMVIEIGTQETKVNSQPLSPLRVTDLELSPMKPFEVSFTVSGNGGAPAGMIIYGKAFGLYGQHIRATISHVNTEQTANTGKEQPS